MFKRDYGTCSKCGTKLSREESTDKVMHICPVRDTHALTETEIAAIRELTARLMDMFGANSMERRLVNSRLERGIREHPPHKIRRALRDVKATLNRVIP